MVNILAFLKHVLLDQIGCITVLIFHFYFYQCLLLQSIVRELENSVCKGELARIDTESLMYACQSPVSEGIHIFVLPTPLVLSILDPPNNFPHGALQDYLYESQKTAAALLDSVPATS